MKMYLRISILLNILIILYIISCINKSANISIDVDPLRENYPYLLEEAKKWQDDAYLEKVSFEFDNQSRVIIAQFKSPTTTYESLEVIFSPFDGEILTNTINHEIPIQVHNQILEKDWKIDSTDAIEKFMSFNDIRNDWLNSEPRCNSLALRYFFVDQDWVLAWVLVISDCTSTVRYYYLDPLTGSRINLDY